MRRFMVVQSAGDVSEIGCAWQRLQRRASGSHSLFQSHDWCRRWLEDLGSAFDPFVIAGYVGTEVVFIWPLMTERGSRFPILRWLSEPYSQYGDVLVAPDLNVKAWMAAALPFIAAQGNFHGMHLRHVRDDAAVYSFLKQEMRRVGEETGAPYMDLRQFADEAAYLARYSKVQRRRRVKIRNDLERMGPLSFQTFHSGPALAATIDKAVGAKRRWLLERGLYSVPLQADGLAAFLKTLASRADGDFKVVATLLRAGDRDISFEIGFRFKDRHCGYITAHDPDLTDSSPARLHMDLSQRHALTTGASTFDLMVPSDPHKVSWSSDVMAVSDYWHPLSLAGEIYGRLYLNRLRPWLRRAYLASPAGVRRAAGALLR
ncbi:MAG TPA: GNAT family N-acetyltransferase [Aestuariivirgaceae bacterium]|nr:GNAT family N-acetyltransferase [Aestuariivirgaceae bacterium]